MTASWVLLLSLLNPATSAQIAESPTLRLLQAEAGRDLAAAPTLEDAKNQAGTTYTGEKAQDKASGDKSGPSYHFKGETPIDGITIYTPEADAPGNDTTKAPEKKTDWKPYAFLGAGVALAVAGAFLVGPNPVAGGLLLLLGGICLGIGGLLWFINRK